MILFVVFDSFLCLCCMAVLMDDATDSGKLFPPSLACPARSLFACCDRATMDPRYYLTVGKVKYH